MQTYISFIALIDDGIDKNNYTTRNPSVPELS